MVQPTIRPLHNSRSAGEVLTSWVYALAGTSSSNPQESWLEYLKTYWKQNIYSKKNTLDSFESFWEGALQDGYVTESLPAQKIFHANTAVLSEVTQEAKPQKSDSLELQLTVSPTIFDGRCANVGSLQELPDPVTKITWDNVAAMSPKTADKLGVKQGNIIELSNR
ncbi:MAG: hypothetical protein HYW85_02870, partial [Deltaproteobacteria bacterium]|nr:hypothetical protein [Deltaproteobacteria bacterium]